MLHNTKPSKPQKTSKISGKLSRNGKQNFNSFTNEDHNRYLCVCVHAPYVLVYVYCLTISIQNIT